LSESEEKFRTVADWTYDWEYWLDPNGHVVYMSPSCERIAGYRPTEFADDPALLKRVVHPDDSKAYEEHAIWTQSDAALAHEGHEEFRIVALDGSEHWIDHICRAVFSEEGQYLGQRVSNRDISDRKKAEKALRESEERLRSIFEHSLDGILLSEPDGKVFKANPAACFMLGRNEQEICEVGRDGLIDHEDHRWKGFLEQRKRTGKLRGELNLMRKDGTRFPSSISTSVFNAANGERRTTLIIRDITERKQAECALKEKNDVLELSNKDLEQFAYVAAHDLREPLVGVAAYLKLLERRTGTSLDNEARRYLSKALETVLRMDRLIQGLLKYSRVSEGQQKLESTDCNLCLSEAVSNLRAAINESCATIRIDPMPTVLASRMSMTQLFQNLIGNAIKFRGDTPLRIHVGVDNTEPEHKFWVRDNGMGIEPPHFDRIFQIFQRVDNSVGPGGTGIGLATCRKIVERLGGRIWVESVPGRGSTFYFTLPRR
jgi:PAS domain S-box-containing protein